jgi:hypothetical protein
MKVREWTRGFIDFRKQAKSLLAKGYVRCEVEWKLQRGDLNREEYKIEDVKISTDGKYVYYLLNQEARDWLEYCEAHEENRQVDFIKSCGLSA